MARASAPALSAHPLRARHCAPLLRVRSRRNLSFRWSGHRCQIRPLAVRWPSQISRWRLPSAATQHSTARTHWRNATSATWCMQRCGVHRRTPSLRHHREQRIVGRLRLFQTRSHALAPSLRPTEEGAPCNSDAWGALCSEVWCRVDYAAVPLPALAINGFPTAAPRSPLDFAAVRPPSAPFHLAPRFVSFVVYRW